ncbi:hypothetical protein KPH14_007088 [Odynerus spinipes]|uniref:Uncharacterized protein n=1 Tax=Odynerus spinipes TaxID=1348599 RepID=A0AAD9VRW8_9HYME|nr:hypothetical protein KPH14_007088 [Odynerus spinipes]
MSATHVIREDNGEILESQESLVLAIDSAQQASTPDDPSLGEGISTSSSSSSSSNSTIVPIDRRAHIRTTDNLQQSRT